MDISEIKERYTQGLYTYSAIIPESNKTLLPPDYIFDEELTVRRNRELVAEHNERVKTLKNDKITRQAALDRQLTYDVVEYITSTYDLTERQARLVELFVNNRYHSCMMDYFNNLDNFCELAETLVNEVG